MQTVQFLFLSRFPRPTVSCSIMQGSWSTCAATTNKKCIFNIDLDFLPGWPLGFGRLLTTIFFTILLTNYRLFDTLSTNFIDFSIFWIFGPDIDVEPELNFHIKTLAHFWMWLDEEAKMGLILSVFHKFFVLCGSSWWLCVKNLENIKNYWLFGKISTI